MRKRLSVGFAVVIAMMLVAPTVLAAKPIPTTTVVVTANDLETETDLAITRVNSDKWFFYNDENDTLDNTLGSFVPGPGNTPEGQGSAEISVTGTQRRNLATYQFRGTPLADITSLAYSTYNASASNDGSPNNAGYLQFNVDFDGSDTWQKRLIYLPKINGAVVPDQWQEWNTVGSALWGWSGYANGPDGLAATIGDNNSWPDGETAQYRTWDNIVGSFSGVRIRVSDPWVGIRVGEPYPDGYTENIDAFEFGTTAGITIFDFEPLVGPPTSMDDCKDGGWMTYTNPSFKTQGECVSYVRMPARSGN